MAIPNSGELGLYKDIWGELGGTKGENSLHSASVAVGFATPDSMGDFYGYVDATQPSMGGVTLTSVTCTSMTANSSYSTPAGTPVAYGFYFGRGSSNHTQNTKYTESNSGGLSANFNRSFTSLQSTATYYAWSWASNGAGEGVSSRAQATTQTPLHASQNYGACACNFVYSSISPPTKFFKPAKMSLPTFLARTVLPLAIPIIVVISLFGIVSVVERIIIYFFD